MLDYNIFQLNLLMHYNLKNNILILFQTFLNLNIIQYTNLLYQNLIFSILYPN